MATMETEVRYKILLHVQESLMDLLDDGNLEGQELIDLNDSMGEVAGAILDALGLEVISTTEDGVITASLRLQFLE